MKTSATAKYVGTSARKTGLVAALIRGKRAVDARQILANTDKRATTPVGKVLESAIANAENNYSAKTGDLVVESVLIGPGPTLKRSRPRAKGSASAIRKRSSHITVVITDGKSVAKLVTSEVAPAPKPEVKAPAKEAAKPATKASTRKVDKKEAK
jgi:large subunit ribosomal protein L22